jgi:hypothetical protein
VVGDLIMAEVLQGFALERDFRIAESALAALQFRAMGGYEIAIAAARNHRTLRSRGVAARSTVDTIIATFCIAGAMTFFIATATLIPSSVISAFAC